VWPCEKDNPDLAADMNMGHFFKHMAVRLWTTLFLGGLSTLVVMPLFGGFMKPDWMIGPGLGLLFVAYWLTGTAFAAMGRRRLARLISEAGVWARAGMAREARQALAQAESTVDSFYFSPFSRRVPAGRLLAQTVRFRLAQNEPETASDPVIGAYLQHFPHDRETAVRWLDDVSAGRPVTRKTHDIAAAIGAALPEDGTIQRMLARFYLLERRCDFAALQTYGRVMDDDAPVTDDLLVGLTDLFLAQRRTDSLALGVYLDAFERGHRDERLLAGIAAGRRVIHPGPLTLPLLDKADAVLEGTAPSQRSAMASRFLPESAAARPEPPAARQRIQRRPIGPVIRKILAGLIRWTAAGLVDLGGQLRRIRGVLATRQARSALKWISMGVFVVAVGWLVINTAMHLAAGFKTVEKAPKPVVVPVTDPFTLQVAAYLKESDARRFADQLKKQGLDAYWTRASGANKTWYQVRVSHFATKAQARAVGDDLIKRKLVSDYYVANYKRPDVP
jgi:hypothetical protein